jgi:DNA-binding transcriptional ArsR family regulator
MKLADESAVSDGGLDAIFGALATERRRSVVRCLDEHGSPLTLDVLADVLAAAERSATAVGADPAVADDIYTTLYHVHVPKLVAAGIVEYDRQGDTIERAEHAETAIGFLDAPETAVSG